MKDPSFIQCLNQHAGAAPAEYVNVVATCYGFVGRPRYLPLIKTALEETEILGLAKEWLRDLLTLQCQELQSWIMTGAKKCLIFIPCFDNSYFPIII